MFLVDATNAGGRLLDLNTELIRVLDKVRELLENDGEVLDWGDVLLELYRKRDARSVRAAVIDEALSELGIDEADVFERLDQLEGYLVEIQERMEPLLLRLGTPGSLVDAEIGFSAGDRSLQSGQVAFLVGGDLQADLEVRSYAGSTRPDDWTGPLAAGRALQEVAIGGNVAIRGSGRGAWGALAAEASAAASTSGRVRVYHEFSAETPRIAALAVASTGWAVPWDLDGLFDELRRPGATGFRSIVLNGSGNVEFAGSLGVGYRASFDRDVLTPDGTEALRAEAGVDGTLELHFKRSGSFAYRIDKDASGALRVRIERAAATRRAAELDLGASVEIHGLDGIADRYARAFFKDPETLLDQLDDWTRPGDRVVDAIAKKDWDHPVVKQIGALLIGEGTAKQLSNAAVTRLETAIGRELNERLPFWSADSRSLARKLTGRLSERFDLDGELGGKLREAIEDKLAERIDQARGKLEGHVGKLLDSAGDAGAELLDPLEAVGIDVSALREEANATAGDLLQPVIDYLKRYERIRLRLLAALKQTARLKLGIRIGGSISRSRETSTLLSFRIHEVDKTTRTVHRAFVLGRLGQAWPEFETACTEGAIDDVDGLFGFIARRESKLGFSLHFGDFGSVQRYRAKAEEVHFHVDPSGNILAANAVLEQEAVARAFHVRRSIGVVGSYDLVAALRDPAQLPAPLSFSIGYGDGKLRSPELAQFLGSLEDDRLGQPLLAPGAADAALDRYRAILEQHGLSHAQARIDLAIPVTPETLAKLVEVRDAVGIEFIRRAAVEIQLRVLLPHTGQAGLLHELAAAHAGSVDPVDFALAMYERGIRRSASHLDRLSVDIWGRRDTRTHSVTDQLARRINRIGLNANAIVRVVEGIAAIADLQDQLRSLDVSPTEADLEPLRRRIALATEKINNGLDNWLKVRGVISGLFDEALPEQTVAFLALLAELSPEHQRLMPIVKVDNVDNGLLVVA
jgi:hypothetical protein